MARTQYANLNPSIRPRISALFKWAVVDRITGRRPRSPETAPIPVVDEVDFGTVDTASVTWLGHATALISVAGEWVITDPVFSETLSGLVKRRVLVPLPPDELPKINTVLLSHNHRDHLDKSSLLAVESHSSPRYIVPLGVEKVLMSWRIPEERIVAMGWWNNTMVSQSLKITCVPAQHWSRRGMFDLNTSWWCGFVLEGSNGTIYFVGDSGYFDHFEAIGDRFENIDVALIPIGAYDPQWFMSPQHMNPEEAVQAMQDIDAKKMIPIHWGTYKLSDEPLDEPPELLKAVAGRRNVSHRIAIPAVGETVRV